MWKNVGEEKVKSVDRERGLYWNNGGRAIPLSSPPIPLSASRCWGDFAYDNQPVLMAWAFSFLFCSTFLFVQCHFVLLFRYQVYLPS